MLIMRQKQWSQKCSIPSNKCSIRRVELIADDVDATQPYANEQEETQPIPKIKST